MTAHEYVSAYLGHADRMCRFCGGTPAENAVLGPNHCPKAPHADVQLTEAEQLAALEAMAKEGRRINIDFDGFALFAVVSAVQLATRHPQLPTSMRPILLDFIEHASETLSPGGGTIAVIIARGNDPAQDEPIEHGT